MTLDRRALILSTGALAFLAACNGALPDEEGGAVAEAAPSPVQVEYPEVYELANIILALTEYGLTDRWQVRKDFDYYDRMRDWFEPAMDHPLLEAVNFSRDLWKEYLSFRTDAYAFRFGADGKLERTSDFHAFEISAFDDHLSQVEDFARQSRFREFFQANKAFRDDVVARYQDSYRLEDMRGFLSEQFGAYLSDRQYVVALSPFVYAQNLHRDVSDTLTVDFPTVAPSILKNEPMSVEEQVSELHTLFTEMSHGYVDPVTAEYADLVSSSFDAQIWGAGSGYEDAPNAVFNEYMTWAAYDLFVETRFPDHYEQAVLDWHRQNETRGFIYSGAFGHLLSGTYAMRRMLGAHTVRDLYPVLLEKIVLMEPTLVKPVTLNSGDVITGTDGEAQWVAFDFNVPMMRADRVDAKIVNGDASEIVRFTGDTLRWSDDDQRLELKVALRRSASERHGIVLNAQKAPLALESHAGIMLATNSSRRAVIG